MIEKLKNIQSFRVFSENSLQDLANLIVLEKYTSGATIFNEGDPGQAIYIIVKGKIAIKKQNKLLGLFTEGDMFGEMALFESKKRSATAIARTDSILYKLNNSEFKKFLTKHHEEGLYFLFNSIKELSIRLRRTSKYFIMVYETGKIVGRDLSINELSKRILKIMSGGIEGVNGGMVCIKNPFSDMFQTVYKTENSILTSKNAEHLIKKHSGNKFKVLEKNCWVMGASMVSDNKNLGYILLGKDKNSSGFSLEDEIILKTVCNQVGLGIVKAFKKQEDENREKLAQKKIWGY